MDTRPVAVKNFLAYSLTRLGLDHVDIYRPGRLDPNVPIAWTGSGRLQESTDFSSWSVITNAPNPYQVTPGTAPYKYYRVISP